MIRLFEYDAQIAIEDAEQKRNEVIYTFPHTTVLYLRCSKNTPSRMKVTIKVPGDSAGYEIPIMKVPEYTLGEIMGGQILELECVKQWNAVMEEGRDLGRAEGANLGRLDGLSALVKL